MEVNKCETNLQKQSTSNMHLYASGKCRKSLFEISKKSFRENGYTINYCQLQLMLSHRFSPCPQVGWFPSTYVEEGEEWTVQHGKNKAEVERQQWSEQTNGDKQTELLHRCLLQCYFSEWSSRLRSPLRTPLPTTIPEAFVREKGLQRTADAKTPHHLWLTLCD